MILYGITWSVKPKKARIFNALWRYVNLYEDMKKGSCITIPNFILSFTCPKTLDLSGFSPFFRFLVRPFYAFFCNWRRSLLQLTHGITGDASVAWTYLSIVVFMFACPHSCCGTLGLYAARTDFLFYVGNIAVRCFRNNDKSTIRSGAHSWVPCAHRNRRFRYAHFCPLKKRVRRNYVL